ncbi:MAG TPA: NAD(P)/FAD-dependent oxidoreductase [Terriglobales bacterium]|nr:NAD(P)/FAD-dependent oxidoreductase [Terriglobales bacterium]
MTDFDLAVLGGGPAGTSAAITAARAGANVVLFERGRIPRHKVCGEFVSPEALALLRSLCGGLLDANTLVQSASTIDRARVFAEGYCYQIPLNPPGVSISRFVLDDMLWRATISAGVKCLQQTAVESVHQNGTSRFEILSSAGKVWARAVINASGRWSNLNRRDDLTHREQWLGLKCHFNSNEGFFSTDLYFFPGGYCGVQPVGDGRVNTSAVVRTDMATSLDEVLAADPQLRTRSREWKSAIEPISTFPLTFHRPVPTQGLTLNVGDAAAFIDPFLGDGISLALHSGALAARDLQTYFCGRASLAQVVEGYRTAYLERFAAKFRIASWLRSLLPLSPSLRKAVALALTAPGLMRFLMHRTRV